MKSGDRLEYIVTGPIAAYCPMVISKKKHGMPINNNIRAYGIRKAPPPCLKHKYGNLQTLPKPETKIKQLTDNVKESYI